MVLRSAQCICVFVLRECPRTLPRPTFVRDTACGRRGERDGGGARSIVDVATPRRTRRALIRVGAHRDGLRRVGVPRPIRRRSARAMRVTGRHTVSRRRYGGNDWELA